MALKSTHFKLGLFTLLALAALLITAFGLGIEGMHHETMSYHTYFDESVQGLDVGAPVKYRGVQIGNVTSIAIAPDEKHIDVTMGLDRKRIEELKLNVVSPDLRAQLGTQGITGVKLIDIDFLGRSPPPALPFPPADKYIPAAPSLLKGLEDNIEQVSEKLPDLVETMTKTLADIDRLLLDVTDQRIAARVAKVLDGVDGTVSDIDQVIRHIDHAKIPDKTATALDDLSGAIAKVNGVLDRIGGDGGLVASTQRATESIGDLGRSTTASTREIGRTLRDLDRAAQALRDLADAVERDPEMLVKGRVVRKEP